jgi:hypothetical protein
MGSSHKAAGKTQSNVCWPHIYWKLVGKKEHSERSAPVLVRLFSKLVQNSRVKSWLQNGGAFSDEGNS